MNPIVAEAISKPAYGSEYGNSFEAQAPEESPPKRLSRCAVTASETPAFHPPRRNTVHPFKCNLQMELPPNQKARHQNSGRHDQKRGSSQRTFLLPTWIVVQPLPHDGFRYSFTLSPKCFSSFAHATCALSVFLAYLVLAEVYLPFALHSQAVLLRKYQGVVSAAVRKRGYHPLGHSIPGRLFQRAEIQGTSYSTIRM